MFTSVSRIVPPNRELRTHVMMVRWKPCVPLGYVDYRQEQLRVITWNGIGYGRGISFGHRTTRWRAWYLFRTAILTISAITVILTGTSLAD